MTFAPKPGEYRTVNNFSVGKPIVTGIESSRWSDLYPADKQWPRPVQRGLVAGEKIFAPLPDGVEPDAKLPLNAILY